MPGAGDLRDRVRFDRRSTDVRGDALGPMVEHATVAAAIAYLRGSEPVMAQRLQGVQPVVITVRASSQTRAITPAFQAVKLEWRSGAWVVAAALKIRAVSPNRDDAAFLDILAEARTP